MKADFYIKEWKICLSVIITHLMRLMIICHCVDNSYCHQDDGVYGTYRCTLSFSKGLIIEMLGFSRKYLIQIRLNKDRPNGVITEVGTDTMLSDRSNWHIVAECQQLGKLIFQRDYLYGQE